MSRIGKRPIPVPDNVTATIDGQHVSVKGPKGELAATLVEDVLVKLEDGQIEVQPRNESKRARSMWGMSRTIVNNLVTGVTEGFTRKLEINGVGYRAQMTGKSIQLQLGLSHDVIREVPEGLEVKCPKPTEIEISGIEKQRVGQFAAELRGLRPPEPYKGKGIKYAEERIIRKEGKKK
ncbi:50S ribosomal protein L6 [Dichotomicrobium thermohalophilum]|uniref:Large ribosomal subunit protein uL6 n=1 Tax=Dichotomicrobium thermohalophilum TaxID=933063 RepID=A0A397Q5H0_9HYPH|nr:50S ribosomal protein L6 [Dichotomicrobium thermohalophilum]RIA56536.1 large subunit ribosomal protein L6 [Dichotomicrobium thermohalophilum]